MQPWRLLPSLNISNKKRVIFFKGDKMTNKFGMVIFLFVLFISSSSACPDDLECIGTCDGEFIVTITDSSTGSSGALLLPGSRVDIYAISPDGSSMIVIADIELLSVRKTSDGTYGSFIVNVEQLNKLIRVKRGQKWAMIFHKGE